MKRILILILLTSQIGCSIGQEVNTETEYLRWIGDSEFDISSDDSTFSACNGDEHIIQYFNLGQGPVYSGEKSSFVAVFEDQYKPIFDDNQNGFVRVRFVVNCNGRAGRFRLLQSDTNYNEMAFSEKIVSQLMEITKGMEEWVVLYNDEGIAVDYYNYLVFKITNGEISEILP